MGRNPIDLSTEQKEKRASEQRKAWQKNNTKAYTFRFNVASDSDVIKQLGNQESAIDYIRKLILKDINK